MWLRLSFVIRTLFGNKGLAFATRQVRWLTFAVRLKELTHGIFDAISIRREPILVELGGSCISRSSPFPYLFPLRSCRAARKTLTIMGRVANDLNNSGGPCAIKSTNFNEVTVTAVELRPRKVALGIVTWCTKRPAQGGLAPLRKCLFRCACAAFESIVSCLRRHCLANASRHCLVYISALVFIARPW